ncbi:MAG: adenylate/guanylate cyclase domain-containing protein [Pseudomonadota bacterium]
MRRSFHRELRPRVHDAVISPRLKREIESREQTAELLVAWIGLIVVLFFGVLYSFAPRAEGTAGFNAVPLALAHYLVFAVIRLVVITAGPPPRWFVLVSIVVDFALLYGLIYSFHIQYDQPPAFYLKSPTLFYVFLFISLRALRFDPFYVIFAGVVAAAGWVALSAYALNENMDLVTRNYVTYLTSNSILLGAQMDVVLIILGVTGLLAAALFRARALLVDSVRDAAAVDNLSRFFASDVADTLSTGDDEPRIGQGLEREAAILMVDVRGFTRTTRDLPASDIIGVLARYHGIVVEKIRTHNGSVDKYLGDGVLATFGAVTSSPTAARDALGAARDIVDAIDASQDELKAAGWPEEFRIGVAVTYGAVNVGIVGSDDRMEFTVIGDAVNLCAKLEDMNKTIGSRALTTPETLAIAQSQGFAPHKLLEQDSRQTVSLPGGTRDVEVAVLAR